MFTLLIISLVIASLATNSEEIVPSSDYVLEGNSSEDLYERKH